MSSLLTLGLVVDVPRSIAPRDAGASAPRSGVRAGHGAVARR
ncbi:hypothetical protein [Serinicoccus marinus]|nr:hypothetical protein [Serinicoccus marinus]